jgi:O-antigen/teichoic acid export membrane protein
MTPRDSNILWILFDKGGRILIAFCTGVIVARLLAPEQFGILSLANATVAVLSFLNLAAIEGVVVWALVRNPDEKGVILGCACLLRFLGGLATVGAVMLISPLYAQQPPMVALIAPIIATTTLFSSLEVGEYWLRQIFASKYSTIVRQLGLLLGAGARIWAAGLESPLVPLSLVIAGESLLIAGGLVLSLRLVEAPPWRWRIVFSRCRNLLVDALPLLLAAAAVGLYVRVGVLILGRSHGAEAVGIYSVATIMAETIHALPVAVMATVSPMLLAIRVKDEAAFDVAFQRWLARIVWLGLAVCTILYLAAPRLMALLFGSHYEGSVEVFEWLIWSAFFVYLSIASEPWILGNGHQRYQLPKALLAAAVSIVLTLKLAPSMGANGVAIATGVSYATSAWISNLLFHQTRPLFRMQVMALFPFLRYASRQEKA